MSNFQYRDLGEEDQPIRLVTILPGSDDQPISLELHHTTIPQKPYEALSYVWGLADDMVAVSIAYSNDPHQSTFMVSRNLFVALQHLRRPQEQRIMWIDAICINQDDIAERNVQVHNMGNVYRLARRVIVWLGEASNDSDFIMSLLQNSRAQHMPSAYTDDGAQRITSEPPQPRTLYALYHLLQRPWFKRVWVRQEIGLANNDSEIMCGHMAMPWYDFHRAVPPMYRKSGLQHLGEKQSVHEDNYRDLRRMTVTHNPRSLQYRLYEVRRAKCLDPKDRIYANLNLTTPVYRDKIKVDYNLSTLDLYRQLVLVDLEMRTLSILGHCDIATRPEGWPSWVPDWSNPFSTRFVGRANSSSHLLSYAEYIGHGALQAKGLVLSRIDSLDKIEFCLDRSNFDVELLRLARARVAGSYVNGKSLLEAFCDTICYGSFFKPGLSRVIYPVLEETMAYVESLVANLENDQQSCPRALADQVPRSCRGRSMFQTEHGHLGLGPDSSRLGDLIVILFGCAFPLVLRPNEAGEYEVVGQCYVSCFMQGEAILGQPPHHYRHGFDFERSGDRTYRRSRFVNTISGEPLDGDPRVKAFRRRLEHFEDAFQNDDINFEYNHSDETVGKGRETKDMDKGKKDSDEHSVVDREGSEEKGERSNEEKAWLRAITPEMLGRAGFDVKVFKLV